MKKQEREVEPAACFQLRMNTSQQQTNRNEIPGLPVHFIWFLCVF